MKIDCDVLGGNKLESKGSSLLFSSREVLAAVKIVQLGDQECILRCLSLYVICPTSLIK